MKSTHIVRAALVAALAVTAVAQAQTVYRWVDKDGKVHFSDSPPPVDAQNATQKRFGTGNVDETQLPYATREAARRNPVTLYTGTDCGDPCTKARELLAKRGIPYAEKDAQNNPQDQEALKKLIGTLDVPVLVIGAGKVKGYDEDQWQTSLDGAGYPRTRLPGQASLRTPPAPAAPAKAEGADSAEPADSAPK